MAAKFKVGDIVRLNDEGLKGIWGTTVGLSFMKQKVMTVVSIDRDSITFPEETYPMSVSDKEIDQFMISDYMFDLVYEAANKANQIMDLF